MHNPAPLTFLEIDMKIVYLLWYSDGKDKWVEAVHAKEDEAFAHMRMLKSSSDNAIKYHYWIQEKGVI
jgi:hypothetical protein